MTPKGDGIGKGEESLREILETDRTEGSKRVYLRGVRDFAEANRLTPDQILEAVKAKPNRLPKFFATWVKARRNLSKNTIDSRIAGLRLWFSLNEHWSEETDSPPFWRAALRKRKTLTNGKKRRSPAVAVEDKDVSLNELRTIFSAADNRGKAFVSLLYSSGARIGAAIALKFGDFKDSLEADRDSYAVKLVNKGGDSYTWFVSREARDWILAHRKDRQDKGERISRESPVISAYSGRHRTTGQHFTRSGAEQMTKRLLRRAGFAKPHVVGKDKNGKKVVRFGIHPHLLRKLHRTALSNAQVRTEFAEAGLGHAPKSDDMIPVYDMNLGKTESLRLEYDKALPYLTLMADLPTQREAAIEIAELKAENAKLRQMIADLNAGLKGQALERGRLELTISQISDRLSAVERQRKAQEKKA